MITLGEISKAEAARYMGIRTAPDGQTAAILDKYEVIVRDRLKPSYVYREADVEISAEGVHLAGFPAVLTGKSIRKHLEGCNRAVVLAATVSAEAYGDLRVIKSVCPNPVVCGEQINYIIDLYNYGNNEVGNVVLSDTFDPLLTDLNVSVDGSVIPASQYDYINGTLTLPNRSGSEITVPAASFTRNGQSGAVNINPGHVRITLSGSIAL